MKILKNIFALFITLFCTWFVGFAVFTSFVLLAKPQNPMSITDSIVVLTGGGQRIEEGLKLFAERKSKELFISGVHKDVIKRDVTDVWRNPPPLPPCCITLGYKATTTEENALETKEWIKQNNIKSIRLVTGNYHMARSLIEFYAIIPGIIIYAHPVRQPELTLSTPDFWILLLTEYHKIIYRGLQMGFNK